MFCCFFNKTYVYKCLPFLLYMIVVFLSFYIISCSSADNDIKKGEYIVRVKANETKSGVRTILEIDGEIIGPACINMKLTVNFLNKFANRAHKVIFIKNIKDNVPRKFSDFDEVFPTKEHTAWNVDEVYAVCQD